jgi:hypothetical protein
VATVLSNKAVDIATAHVLAGALSLATGAVLCTLFFRSPKSAPENTSVLSRSPADTQSGHPAAAKAVAAS